MNRKQSIFLRAHLVSIQKQKRIIDHNWTQWQWSLSRKTLIARMKNSSKSFHINMYNQFYILYFIYIYIFFVYEYSYNYDYYIYIHTYIRSSNCIKNSLKSKGNNRKTTFIRIWDLKWKKESKKKTIEWGRIKTGPGLLGNYVIAIDLSSIHNLPLHTTYHSGVVSQSKLLR